MIDVEQNKQRYKPENFSELEKIYLENVNATLYLVQKWAKEPPASQTKKLAESMIVYRKKWNKVSEIDDDYLVHINKVIKWAMKFWAANRANGMNVDENGIVDKSLALELAGGIINLQKIINWDTNRGCFTIEQNHILTETLNPKYR